MVDVDPEMNKINNTHPKRRIAIILIAVGIVIISGGITLAALSLLAPKKDDQSVTSGNDSKEAAKKQADEASADAKDLIDETAKLGNTKESDKKTEEAAAKFNEASKQYEQAGDKEASYEAKANADALASRLKAEEDSKAKLEAEQARQKAAYEAAKAAMLESGQ